MQAVLGDFLRFFALIRLTIRDAVDKDHYKVLGFWYLYSVFGIFTRFLVSLLGFRSIYSYSTQSPTNIHNTTRLFRMFLFVTTQKLVLYLFPSLLIGYKLPELFVLVLVLVLFIWFFIIIHINISLGVIDSLRSMRFL